MVRDQGYKLPSYFPDDNNYVESIAAGTSTPASTLSLLIVDQGLNPPGHRNHLLGIDDFNVDNREIGVGHAFSD